MKRIAMFLMACLLCAGILVVAPPEASAAVQEIPLVECERINRSNEDGHYADVVVGKWDCKAGRLADSIRFCVANKKSYKNTLTPETIMMRNVMRIECKDGCVILTDLMERQMAVEGTLEMANLVDGIAIIKEAAV